MNIGERLKSLREDNGMTRKDTVKKLKELGIDISDKTLYGYESGRNSANADMFLALCKIYKCNNIMETFSDMANDILFTNAEWEFLEKYRNLDSHGKEMVDFTLNKEYERSIDLKMAETKITKFPAADELTVQAAHNDKADDPEEQEKISHDLSGLKRPEK